MSGFGGAFTIDSVPVGRGAECYVVAEIGHNHQGSLDLALKLVEEAHRCGAHAVKLQKRDNRSLYTAAYYDRLYDNPNSFGTTYGEHREALELGRSEYVELIARARELDIALFATAFDFASVDFLADLDIPAYKVASGDLRNTPLLEYVAATGKPIIVSTGGGTMDDVLRAYEAIAAINPQIALLQCTCGYPAEWGELDLRVIETYVDLFPGAVVGFSGHDSGIAMALVAYVLGARIVEKHFTLNRAMKGTDHAFSLEPQGLSKLVRDLRRAQLALGEGVKRVHPSERGALEKMGKKIVARRALPAGHVLGPDDLALRSPGDGLVPYELERVIGRTLAAPVAADDAIAFELLADAQPAWVESLAHDGR